MKIVFKYNTEKDIWCLLNYGKSSSNSSKATKVYEKLIAEYGENPTNEQATSFLEKYISGNNINVQNISMDYKNEWSNISDQYIGISEQVFGLSLSADITAYLTVNSRCPYRINKNFFFVSLSSKQTSNMIIMHELWHFYTWYKFGVVWEDKLGKEKYNELKESLTVLLNVECRDLLPNGLKDEGYPQHQDLRNRILEIWQEEKDIEKIWEKLV